MLHERMSAPAAALTADPPLMEAGVDSLASADLSSRLRTLTGVGALVTVAFDPPTTGAFAAHLLEQTSGAAAEVLLR